MNGLVKYLVIMMHRPITPNILGTSATLEKIASNQRAGSLFPGGYRKIVQYLKTGQFWVSWKYTEPGETSGMAYEGLVWMGEVAVRLVS